MLNTNSAWKFFMKPHRRFALLLFAGLLLGCGLAQAQAAPCPAQLPLPSAFPYDKSAYERILDGFLNDECYAGWMQDEQLRITGPTVATLGTSTSDPHLPAWITTNWGMHNVVRIHYSPDVYRWMCETDAGGARKFVDQCRQHCPTCDLAGKNKVKPIADGSMILKEMFGNTTNKILLDPKKLPPGRVGMAFMVKDSHLGKDHWWWGAWVPYNIVPLKSQLDWPPPTNFPYPWMGSGYYCVNCHTSAANNDESTFSSLNNIHGKPNTFTTFMFQDQPPLLGSFGPTVHVLDAHELKLHVEHGGPNPNVNRVTPPLDNYSVDFLTTFAGAKIARPEWGTIGKLAMPPQPYDHVITGPNKAPPFVTSDQCLSCHGAGSTGMHFDMTLQDPTQPAYTNLLNLAPWGEWNSSPMGLAGRDPIFFSQLETEQKVHPALVKLAPDMCLHCHGVMGQRQFCLDQFPNPQRGNEVCNNTNLLGLDKNSQPIVKRELYSRDILNVIPYKATGEEQKTWRYGALSRDGVSCSVCHHIKIESGNFGNTFTGDFRVTDPDKINGPYAKPHTVPMEHALGYTPTEYENVKSSKICGSCHSVVLPVFNGSKPWVAPGDKDPKIIIEQATYPEWVFSDFRTGGPRAKTCQDCHMDSFYSGYGPKLSFKIASIQEASTMPQVENRRDLSEIDLQPRDDYARHTLVGLNVFLNKFAQQFPDVLGISIQDPMLVSKGVAPLATTFNSMVNQAATATASIAVTSVAINQDGLLAKVEIKNLAGHKFPSGVGFRRLFVEFAVLDSAGQTLWASGRTTPTGVLVDENGKPVKGEFFWKDDCTAMTPAEQQGWFQPHYLNVTRQDQVQIYQSVETDPSGKLTNSFLALANKVKDNRLLPEGWNPSPELAEQEQLGSAKLSIADLVQDVLPVLPGPDGKPVADPYYLPKSQGGLGGGGDALTYTVPLAQFGNRVPASAQATLYYQAIPPFYLQDRFCSTPQGDDTARLYFLGGHTDLQATPVENWKLMLVSSGPVGVKP